MSVMQFNPYTGKPRSPAEITTDPWGLEVIPPDDPSENDTGYQMRRKLLTAMSNASIGMVDGCGIVTQEAFRRSVGITLDLDKAEHKEMFQRRCHITNDESGAEIILVDGEPVCRLSPLSVISQGNIDAFVAVAVSRTIEWLPRVPSSL